MLLDDESAAMIYDYQLFVRSYLIRHYDRIAARRGIPSHKRYALDPHYGEICFDLAMKRLQGKTREVQLAQALKMGIMFGAPKIDQMFEQALPLMHSSHAKADLRREWKILRQVKSGDIPKEASLEVLPDTFFFDNLLKRYRGRPVLVDMWASWCGPCLKSFSMIKEIQKNLGKSMHYVFL